MKRFLLLLLCVLILLPAISMAATEQAKQQAIDDGLAWLAGTMATSGSEGYWSYSNNGTLAATGSAALAFIEEGYLPGSDVVIDGTNYGDVVGKACNYIFNRAAVDGRYGPEVSGYPRYAEDYNNNGVYGDDGGNDQAIFFNPGAYNRNVYTTGVVAPVVYALGEAYTPDTLVGRGTVAGMSYKGLMQDVIDWFSWGQVEPSRGVHRGGWRYDANYTNSDNSTAQWGSLPSLYGDAWGLSTPDFVKSELKLWTDYVQNDNGGSGYHNDYTYVNVSKTGGLLVEFAEMGYDIGVNNSDGSGYNSIGNEVDAALNFINSRWNNGPSGGWYGNLNHPYAMWAVYKALELYGFTAIDDNGTPLDPSDDFVIGLDGGFMTNAPGGFTIGQDWDPKISAVGDWYSHYSDYLVNIQNANGSWNGYSYFTGALATGWYINILNATGAPPPDPPEDAPVPEPATVLLFGVGLLGLGAYSRKRLNV